MFRLYMDNDVRVEYARQLRSRGHDVVHVKELGTRRQSDDFHVSEATQQGRVLVTHNRGDYELLHRAWQRWSRDWHVSAPHGGILVLPQWKEMDVVTLIEDFLPSALPLANRLFRYDRRGWVEDR